MIYANTEEMQHSENEKTALDLINEERKKNNLSDLKLMDNLTKVSNLKVKELSESKNFDEYSEKNKKRNIQAVFNIYEIENCKYIFQYFDKGSSSINEIISAWLKDPDKRKQLLGDDATHFSLSYLNVKGEKYWYSFIISRADNLDKKKLDKYRQEVIDLVNQERKEYNKKLEKLERFNVMMEAAQIRAKEQVKKSGHKRPNQTDFITVINDVNFSLKGNYKIGENVASGQFTPKEVVEAWMNSTGHRANILNPNYKYIGVGAYMENGKIYWAQIFYNGDTQGRK